MKGKKVMERKLKRIKKHSCLVGKKENGENNREKNNKMIIWLVRKLEERQKLREKV